jgi:3-dehydroquinate dehydratase-1
MNGLICVSLGTDCQHVLTCLQKINPTYEMVEIRIDLLQDLFLKNEEENTNMKVKELFSIAKKLQIQTIATVRDIPISAGFSRERSLLVQQCIENGATFVDIEIESPKEYREELVQFARKYDCKVIVSHHNYVKEEKSSEDLTNIVNECFEKGADIAKVAVAVCSFQGAARVLSCYNDNRPVVALGMGEFGKITRVSSIALGAPFSFAAWDESGATAPGQLTREQMKTALELIGWEACTDPANRKKVKAI